jgi:hypothetical protein
MPSNGDRIATNRKSRARVRITARICGWNPANFPRFRPNDETMLRLIGIFLLADITDLAAAD